MDPDLAAIVFDISGPKRTQAGFAGDDGPRAAFPWIVGRRKNYGICTLGATNIKDIYVGDEVEAYERERQFKLQHSNPIEDGVVVNWNDMEKVWHHAFYDRLKAEPEQHPLLIADRVVLAPKDNRKMMTQVVFETFNVPAFYASYDCSLSMHMNDNSPSRNTGLCIYSCDTFTSVTPVVDGMVMRHAAKRLAIGGRDITDLLQGSLAEKGYDIQRSTVEDMKRKLCHVTQGSNDHHQFLIGDLEAMMSKKLYTLPDGQVIDIDKEERTRAPEIMFNSTNVEQSLHLAGLESIMRCDETVRQDIAGNVLISGGNMRFPGLKERLQKELDKITPADWLPVEVRVLKNEKTSAWISGSILASLSTFSQMWISAADYNETGPSIVHRKCFY
ncbi:actin family [Apodospora peruviana]|uniref:Actin family n=1 Tax=Apodospora peruviana TaxID=516989 RepID=A0AAE0IDQ9_9PEZI|nr:actin family [Apodospora peruviana]